MSIIGDTKRQQGPARLPAPPAGRVRAVSLVALEFRV